MIYAMWAFAGWCGTPFPYWWWFRPPKPDPPEPWWQVKLLSVVGGFVGGWMTTQIIGNDFTAINVLTSFAGAAIGGGFLGGVTGLLAGKRNVPVGANVQSAA